MPDDDELKDGSGGEPNTPKEVTPQNNIEPELFKPEEMQPEETAESTVSNTAENTKPKFEKEIEKDKNTVTVQPVQFASFEDLDQVQGPQNQNLNILLDIKLQLTVELGRTELPIKKVLELTKGSIVTLNKAAGEPVELYANGKLIAYGEVVVIEDNFGLRITHITDPAKRLNSLNANNNTEGQ